MPCLQLLGRADNVTDFITRGESWGSTEVSWQPAAAAEALVLAPIESLVCLLPAVVAS